jgi:hypothetical protein
VKPWVLALALLSCAGTNPYVASGESLNATGQTFVQTSKLFDRAYDSGLITNAQYGEWAMFGRKFQALYPSAVALWQAAVRVGDAAQIGGARALLTQLVGELAGFYAQVSTLVFPLDAGAP